MFGCLMPAFSRLRFPFASGGEHKVRPYEHVAFGMLDSIGLPEEGEPRQTRRAANE